jgi:hypothetical protein
MSSGEIGSLQPRISYAVARTIGSREMAQHSPAWRIDQNTIVRPPIRHGVGWNEIHPIKYCQRIGTYEGNWAGYDVKALRDGCCESIGKATDPLTTANQQQPESQWTIHPMIRRMPARRGCSSASDSVSRAISDQARQRHARYAPSAQVGAGRGVSRGPATHQAGSYGSDGYHGWGTSFDCFDRIYQDLGNPRFQRISNGRYRVLPRS